jgi:hypothetical protein
MLPSPAEAESARRALKAIADDCHPTQADALVLRLWAGPHAKIGPLEEIGKQIIEAEYPKTVPP